MSPAIRLDPAGLDAAGSRADSLSTDLNGLAAAARGISVAGLPPSALGYVSSAKSEAAGKAAEASRSASGQGTALRRRAALARKADAASQSTFVGFLGARGSEFWDDFWKMPNGYDLVGYTDSLREGVRGTMQDRIRESRYARRKPWRAAEAFDLRSNKYLRDRFGTAENWRKQLRRPNSPLNRELRRLKVWEKRTRFLDAPEKLRDQLPRGLGRNPIVKKVPIVSSIAGYAGAKAEGRSNLDAAGKTAAQTAGSVAGAWAGGLVCGAATIGTGGIAALACPAAIFAGGVIGDKVAGALYDPAKKIGKGIVDGVKKIKIKVPHFGF